MLPHFGKTGFLALAVCAARVFAGPYSQAVNDPLSTTDAPVPGFTGPHGIGMVPMEVTDNEGNTTWLNPGNFVNPVFFAWADNVVEYAASEFVSADFSDPQYALGAVTGDHYFGVVSLGDMSAGAISSGASPGTITVSLPRPVANLSGADFVIFENGLLAQSNQGGSGAGNIFGELAYVEVSADGVTFTRFPSTSLNPPLPALPEPLGTAYASLDATNVRNLAGKHANSYGGSWGTPFDLTDVGLSVITHVRIIDIPGNGTFTDAGGRPIYDPWKTTGSGGFDLEAVGAISTAMTFTDWPQLATLAAGNRTGNADPDGDGAPNLLEYAFGTLPWKADAATPVISLVNGRGTITFVRDERLTDLVYEVQASSSMTPDGWTTIASSSAGAPVLGVNGHTPVISESSASPIPGIGVLRKVTVSDIVTAASQTHRFLRVKVSSTSASIPGE